MSVALAATTASPGPWPMSHDGMQYSSRWWTREWCPLGARVCAARSAADAPPFVAAELSLERRPPRRVVSFGVCRWIVVVDAKDRDRETGECREPWDDESRDDSREQKCAGECGDRDAAEYSDRG